LTPLIIAVSVKLSAAPPDKPKLPTIADFNRAMVDERYPQAQQMAGVLLQTGNAGDRAAVSFAYGRILLAQGMKKEFRDYRKAMRKLKLKGADLTLMEVYDAWAEALTEPAAGAIETLEQIVQKQEHCEATAQAADVLAIVYLSRGDYPAAKHAVDDGLKLFSGYQPMQTAYIEQLLRNRLKVRASEAQKLYEAAEKLRGEKKFLEAGRLYVQLQTAFPRDLLVHAATYRMGECLVGLERPSQALELWRKFLKDLPAGPWRGQARVASADLLMEQYDLTGAAEQVRQAAAVLDLLPSPVGGRAPGAEGQALSDHSWQDAASEIRMRQGMLALLSQQYEAASAALKLAANSPRPYSGEGQGGEGRGPPDPVRRQKGPAGRSRVGLDGAWSRCGACLGPDRQSHGPARSRRRALRIGACGPHHEPLAGAEFVCGPGTGPGDDRHK
jgi:TolA-binding protein